MYLSKVYVFTKIIPIEKYFSRSTFSEEMIWTKIWKAFFIVLLLCDRVIDIVYYKENVKLLSVLHEPISIKPDFCMYLFGSQDMSLLYLL
jgi:hypothetical protein